MLEGAFYYPHKSKIAVLLMSYPLFLRDYAHLSVDHVDYNANNHSFLKMYRILKRMGVQNNKFHLLIYDKGLIGIDPHNLPDDSMELKLRIIQECKINPWYYFRSVVRVPASGTDGVPFKINRANMALIWLFLNHIDHLLIMPRQRGKTVSTTAIWSFVMFIASHNINISMLTKDDKLRKENVDRLKDIRDALPPWMIHRQRSDVDSREELSYEVLANSYQTYVAQSSISGAEKLGRGMTNPIQHWDEIPFFNNIQITYPIALSTTAAAIESAKAVNAPYGNILTTTAGKLNTEEGRFTHKILCDALPFNEKLYDMDNLDELANIVKANSKRGIVFSEFSYKQLGATDEWFEAEAAKLGDADVVARDLLNQWTLGGNESPIDKEVLEKIHKSRREPDYVQKMDEFVIRWYIPREKVRSNELSSIPIVIGMDASTNVGRDFTSFVFVDARSLRPIATCSCNTSNIIKVASFICKWLKYPNIAFVPERNHVGAAIVDYCLMKLTQLGINPFFKIYNEIVQNWRSGENKLSRSDLNRPGAVDQHRKKFGFTTSSQSRPFLYRTVFDKVLEAVADQIGDITLINQISGLTIKNGRIDHSDGNHDDSVVACLMAGYFLYYGNNLDMYTFSGGTVEGLLSEVHPTDNEAGDNIDPMDVDQMKQMISYLGKRIKRENNPTVKIELIHQLNRLTNKLPEEDENSLDDATSASQLQQQQVKLPGVTVRDHSTYLSNYFSGLGG